jgi:uncharacterized protein YndB with AHSA1/START domain
MATTRMTTRLSAPRERVYRALVDPETGPRWRAPAGMTVHVHDFQPVQGGRIRISLTYDAPDRSGKTHGHTDTYRGRFVRLVPDELLVEVDEFETDDPALGGEMTITIALSDADGGGTELVAVHEGLPEAVPADQNELGWTEALRRLAAMVQ